MNSGNWLRITSFLVLTPAIIVVTLGIYAAIERVVFRSFIPIAFAYGSALLIVGSLLYVLPLHRGAPIVTGTLGPSCGSIGSPNGVFVESCHTYRVERIALVWLYIVTGVLVVASAATARRIHSRHSGPAQT